MSDSEWRSGHSDEDTIPPSPTTPPTVKRYHIDKDCFSQHYDITTDAGDLVFRVDISRFKSGTPDLTFHDGSLTTSPTVGVCYLPKVGRAFKLGLGDPKQPGGMTWETMNKIDVWALKHHWSTDLLSSPEEPWAKARNLAWKRTSTIKGDEGQAGSTFWRNVKLQDEETGEIVAVYTPTPRSKVRGVLQMKLDAGRSFDLMVLISRLGLIERFRRK